MLRRKRLGVFSLGVFALCLTASVALVTAQETSAPSGRPQANVKRDDVNHEVQVYLLAASNDAAARGAVPPVLEGAIRQLRTTLPFSNYRLITTFLNRVKDNGTVELKGVGSSLMPSELRPGNPIFYDFNLVQVKMDSDAGGQPFIRINRFRFGLRMPIVSGTARVEGSDVGSQVIQYEPVGINTELSLREGTPTVVGTMTTSRHNESLILVLSVKSSSIR